MTATAVGRNRVECVVEAGDLLGETPLWCDRSRRLWWVDIERLSFPKIFIRRDSRREAESAHHWT
jgi:sugar lactone lactonase YvrE